MTTVAVAALLFGLFVGFVFGIIVAAVLTASMCSKCKATRLNTLRYRQAVWN